MSSHHSILIACGGTGGHLFPGIAVAQELRRRGHKPTLLISTKSVDREGTQKYNQLDYIAIPAAPRPSLLALHKWPAFAINQLKTLFLSRSLIRQRGIQAVLGMGGFTSFLPIVAGAQEKLPCMVHDSNAQPGKSNRLTARWCQHILIGLPDAQSHFEGRECIVTGTPTREEFNPQSKSIPNRSESRRRLRIPAQGRLLLVLGGSQGAQKLNEHILAAAALDREAHYLIISGRAHEEKLRAQAQEQKLRNVTILGFCDLMPEAYSACDGVICRSGASTLTELSLMGKAALLIPYPAAADDHQTYNALTFSSRGAALLCPESELNATTIHAFSQAIIGNTEKRRTMEQAMKALSVPDAASRIADLLCHAIQQH